MILDSYLRQCVCVMWDSCKSEYFKIYYGVKQGWVISCHLFNLYIDHLLVQLSNSGYGCHIAGVYAGALSYADDITLLCPSVWGLNEMKFVINIDWKIISFLTVRKQFELNLEVLLLRGNLHFLRSKARVDR